MDADLVLPPEQRPPSPHGHNRLSVPEQSAMKLTRGHSCVLCQQRKVRCDKQKPCANCVKAGVECRVVPPQPPRRRKKKPHERDLIDRLRKYEVLLTQHGVHFDPIAHDLKHIDNADDVADLEQDLSGLKTSPSSAADHVSPNDNDKSKWFQYYKEYRATAEIAQDSSDSEYEGPTLHHAFDTMYENSDGFPFVVGGIPASVTNSHPSAIQIFQLWQVYITNVNPLLKLSHVSTLQTQIISAGANTAKIPKPLEALMFAIYFAAISSMEDDEAQSMFGEDRAIMLSKYHGATQQALINAGFMRATDIMVLQAFVLYLMSIRPYCDPRSLFCMLGMAGRIATRMGLHRDGAQFGLPPFETEQRRRLWWQIVIFDKRTAEITGSSITLLNSSGGDCRLPLNINDTDLNVHAKDPPAPYPGPTEMLFSLTRIELTVAAAPGSVRPNPTTPGGTVINKPRVQYSPSPSSPDVVSHVANQNLPQDLESFAAYIENVYLKHCDPKIPMHFFTLMMTRQAICKLRVIDFLCKGIHTDTLEPQERDRLFMEAIKVVELDNVLQSSPMLQGFRWYTYQHFPFPAYMFLVSELRERTTGQLCERAWSVMIENHERRGFSRNVRTPLHIAFGAFFIKAWEAREAAELQLGRQLQTPKLVLMIRNTVSRFKQTRPASTPTNGAGGHSSGGGGPAGPSGASVAGSSVTADDSVMGGSSSSMYSSNKAMPDAPPPQAAMANPSLMMDDAMMFSSFDGTPQAFGGAAAVADTDFGQMDWNYLVQYSTFGGFNPGLYSQQQPPPHGHQQGGGG
ncbi:fungal-specific transcription factor domain-containing protein [Bombardia bombarda]|uniref:Fungal-specific transcription factor domain-containing protein n=1 Tax=Bombardia bombarda TaxID=252184 RepID=A0AA40CA49_9PEZI|nr:fungal-specific transcription factor domain-containing protein [Bombardia bombarda]